MAQKTLPVTTTVSDALDTARSELESLRDEYQEWYDNLPEAFQNGTKGEELQSAIDQLEDSIGRFDQVVSDLEQTDSERPVVVNTPVYARSKWQSREMRGTDALRYAFAAQGVLEEVRDALKPEDTEADSKYDDLLGGIQDGIDAAEGVEWVQELMKYRVIQPDGSETAGECDDHGLPLEVLQAHVGGYIERVRVLYQGDMCDMFVNEEGLLRYLPFNRRATALYWYGGGDRRNSIVGTVVLFEGQLAQDDDT